MLSYLIKQEIMGFVAEITYAREMAVRSPTITSWEHWRDEEIKLTQELKDKLDELKCELIHASDMSD
jgi:hypothetical protein